MQCTVGSCKWRFFYISIQDGLKSLWSAEMMLHQGSAHPVTSSCNVRFRSLCRRFNFMWSLAPALAVQRKKNILKTEIFTLKPPNIFFSSFWMRKRALHWSANPINPSLGLEPLICNLISGGRLGHEDTQQGQGLLYGEICAFGRNLRFGQQSRRA